MMNNPFSYFSKKKLQRKIYNSYQLKKLACYSIINWEIYSRNFIIKSLEEFQKYLYSFNLITYISNYNGYDKNVRSNDVNGYSISIYFGEEPLPVNPCGRHDYRKNNLSVERGAYLTFSCGLNGQIAVFIYPKYINNFNKEDKYYLVAAWRNSSTIKERHLKKLYKLFLDTQFYSSSFLGMNETYYIIKKLEKINRKLSIRYSNLTIISNIADSLPSPFNILSKPIDLYISGHKIISIIIVLFFLILFFIFYKNLFEYL